MKLGACQPLVHTKRKGIIRTPYPSRPTPSFFASLPFLGPPKSQRLGYMLGYTYLHVHGDAQTPPQEAARRTNVVQL